MLGRRTNIAALGIKDDRNAGMIGMNVGDDTVQRVFRAFGCEVGNLGLKGTDKVCCCINDVCRLVLQEGVPDRGRDRRTEACRHCASGRAASR